MKNLVLIGMPSCGKTTIANALSNKLSMNLVDMDEVIIKNAGISIPEIFNRYQEVGFRKMETEAAKQCCTLNETIISTGGGVIKNKINIDHLKTNGVIIFIDRDLDKLVTYDPNRPLSSSKEAVTKLYEERYPLYTQYADHIVKNNGNIEDTIQEIINIYRNEE